MAKKKSKRDLPSIQTISRFSLYKPKPIEDFSWQGKSVLITFNNAGEMESSSSENKQFKNYGNNTTVQINFSKYFDGVKTVPFNLNAEDPITLIFDGAEVNLDKYFPMFMRQQIKNIHEDWVIDIDTCNVKKNYSSKRPIACYLNGVCFDEKKPFDAALSRKLMELNLVIRCETIPQLQDVSLKKIIFSIACESDLKKFLSFSSKKTILRDSIIEMRLKLNENINLDNSFNETLKNFTNLEKIGFYNAVGENVFISIKSFMPQLADAFKNININFLTLEKNFENKTRFECSEIKIRCPSVEFSRIDFTVLSHLKKLIIHEMRTDVFKMSLGRLALLPASLELLEITLNEIDDDTWIDDPVSTMKEIVDGVLKHGRISNIILSHHTVPLKKQQWCEQIEDALKYNSIYEKYFNQKEVITEEIFSEIFSLSPEVLINHNALNRFTIVFKKFLECFAGDIEHILDITKQLYDKVRGIDGSAFFIQSIQIEVARFIYASNSNLQWLANDLNDPVKQLRYCLYLMIESLPYLREHKKEELLSLIYMMAQFYEIKTQTRPDLSGGRTFEELLTILTGKRVCYSSAEILAASEILPEEDNAICLEDYVENFSLATTYRSVSQLRNALGTLPALKQSSENIIKEFYDNIAKFVKKEGEGMQEQGQEQMEEDAEKLPSLEEAKKMSAEELLHCYQKALKAIESKKRSFSQALAPYNDEENSPPPKKPRGASPFNPIFWNFSDVGIEWPASPSSSEPRLTGAEGKEEVPESVNIPNNN